MRDFETEIAALERAYATGALKVRNSNGEEITYDTGAQILARIRTLRAMTAGSNTGGFLVTQPNMNRGL